jgi:transposase
MRYGPSSLWERLRDSGGAPSDCEAMSRPTMRFVPVKTAEQQAALMLVGLRDRLVRSYAAEFGITGATGLAPVPALLRRIQADETLPPLARELFALHAAEYEQVQAKIAAVAVKLLAWHRADERSRRLAQIPGVGPIGAT